MERGQREVGTGVLTPRVAQAGPGAVWSLLSPEQQQHFQRTLVVICRSLVSHLNPSPGEQGVSDDQA